MRILFVSFLIVAVSACQDPKLKSDPSQTTLDSKDDSSELSDSEVAVEPTPIGGSFLICAHDANLGGTPASFGCRIENEAGTKLSSFKPQATDIVAVALDRTLA
ncbi:hypothetical protein, partial [Oligoflexus sp.]|uniref:hypothetical protein n=1 Tax=Oligoflexus sp. TaxID=1971216 RepID=UPI002D787855